MSEEIAPESDPANSSDALGPKDVYIATLSPGTVELSYLTSIINLLFYDINHSKRVNCFMPRKANANLGSYRNICVEHFLTETDCEWILFIDSDHEFAPDTLDRLLAVASPDTHPVVSGIYTMMLNEGMRLSAFREMPIQLPTGEVTHTLESIPPAEVPVDALIPVDGIGAGCLLIHRALLEAMGNVFPFAQKWFGESVHDGILYGEDFTFCNRVKQMGFPVMIHTGIELGHIKPVVLTPAMAREQAARQEREGANNGN